MRTQVLQNTLPEFQQHRVIMGLQLLNLVGLKISLKILRF